MEGITFEDLAYFIENLKPQWLEANVSVYIPWEDEYMEIKGMVFATEDNGVLDAGHPILYIKE